MGEIVRFEIGGGLKKWRARRADAGEERRVEERRCVQVRKRKLVEGARGERRKERGIYSALSRLRHHEYLIIMSGVTSESPPSDSSRAEFHR